MALSSRANVKFNQSGSDPNDQWMPIQPIGQERVDDWAATVGSINPNSGQVPLQWTSDLTAVTASELIDFNDLEQPVTHYMIAERGGRGNPNEYYILENKTDQTIYTAMFNRYAARFPSRIFVGFVSDRDILDDAELPGRQNIQGKGK